MTGRANLGPRRQQAEESGKLASKGITDERFRSVIPSAPKITNGTVVARRNGGAVS
ncbi:MAG TPA: hypothetical protein VKR21_06260 [Solirubrobacteraceae bacterium]|nr:hypothetical protein [Solirubrobacteraceae bacterium]